MLTFILIKVINNFCSLFFVNLIADNKFSMNSSIVHSHQWELAILYYTGYTEYLQTQHILLLIYSNGILTYIVVLFTLLLWTFSVGTIAYDNFSVHYRKNWKQLLYCIFSKLFELVKCRIIYCTMPMDMFCIHNCKWNLKCKVFQLTFRCTIIFDNFSHALLQLISIVCTISIDNFCIDYYKWGLLYTAERHKNVTDTLSVNKKYLTDTPHGNFFLVQKRWYTKWRN